MSSADTIQKGASEKQVLRLYGLPDVIAERSGDLERWYVGNLIPEYKWPKKAEKRYYYLKKGIVVDLKQGTVVSLDSVKEEDKEIALHTIELAKNGKGIQGVLREN